MPTFLARRYMRTIDEVGRVERVIAVAILVILAGIVATFVMQVGGEAHGLFDVDAAAYGPATGMAGPNSVAPPDAFPDAGLPGWHRPQNVRRYTPETLHQKINGRAEAYASFHVRSLTFGTYTHDSGGQRAVDVYWYAMSEPADAAAIYRAEVAPAAEAVAIGDEGCAIGGAVYFRLGRNYVQVLPGTADAGDADAAREIAAALARRIASP